MPTSRRLPRNALLPCDIARRFTNRPTLFEVAASLLLEQWPTYGLDTSLDPLDLHLASFGPVDGLAYVRPLYQLLVERFCLRTSLNMTPGQDVVCREQRIEPEQPVPIDLARLEALVNDCGPLLLDSFGQAIVDFWCEADSKGETPWSWFASHLQALLGIALGQADASAQPADAKALLQALSEGPAELDDLLELNTTHGITVQTLVSNFSADWQLDPHLASALLFERGEAPGRAPFTLLFTAVGRLLSFPSRARLLESITQHWPALLAKSPPSVKLGTPDRQLFQAQAVNLLMQQLEGIEIAATAFHTQGSAQQLANALDHLTSLTHLCSVEDPVSHASLSEQLPSWVRQGEPRALIVYSSMLTEVARSTSDADGKSWLDGVPSAQVFACERLASLIHRDHPQSTLDPASIRVINHQTTATAIPSAGQVISEGTTIPVTFTLPQLAIANLGLLKPGRVSLESVDGQPIPAWLDTSALRGLITEADIGATYPKRLRELLLDDPQARANRERLLADQLHSQLPAQVMKSYLKDEQPSLQAIVALEHVFAPMADEHGNWVLRPLGLLRTMDATPDHPLNAWLIENDGSISASCLLYRPLHREPIVEFADRLALLVAISEPGDLQNDILHRLAQEDRRIYDHGGFKEPHLFRPLDDDWAVPLFTPAPVTLSREAAISDPAQAIYKACVEETLSNFKAQSTSSEATRWQRWEELGWLLLNSVLPFVEGPFAEAAWLVQMETAFARLVDAREQAQPGDRTGDWIELLVNVAFLIFNHAMQRLELEHPLDAAVPLGPLPPLEPAPVVITSTAEAQIDFSWSQPSLKLDKPQTEALAALQATLSPAALGSPIPAGPIGGLYLSADQLWALIEGKVFKVQLDTLTDQVRIVGAADDRTPGPWLRRDEAGRWQLDLRLRLRGGMPPSKRIARLQEERKKKTEALSNRVLHDSKSIVEQIPGIKKIRTLGQRSDDTRVLRSCLEKLQAFEAFVAEHIQRLHNLNVQTPVNDYKTKRAGTLFQQLDCQLHIRELLMRLFKPERIHLLQMVEHQTEATSEDEAILARRLSTLTTLVDSLFDNASAFEQSLEQLRKLASPSLPKIMEMLDKVERQKGSWTPLYWRFMRIETSVNRMTLVQMDESAVFWLDRTWDSIELAIGQRLQLGKRASASDEVKRRLLENIAQHLATAQRRLLILHQCFEPAAAPAPLKQLRTDINDMSTGVAGELAEYPDLPQRSTVTQLSRQLPGLIETRDDGLLLGQPRADDASIVDIPGAQEGSVTRSYKREHERWVAVEVQPAKTASQSPGKFKALLKESARLLAGARKDLGLMQSARANSYLPVDIEDILLQHRAGLERHRAAIELRLTRDNETDEGTAEGDAALNIKAIEDMSATLAGQAVEQRARVALLQKPRMGELSVLLDNQQVAIHSTGPRRPLAKVAGRTDDYLEEFAIRHAGIDLWYAHFHYSGMEAAQTAYTAGHLKTAEQRYAQGPFSKDAAGHEVAVHRSPIDLASAKQYFFAS